MTFENWLVQQGYKPSLVRKSVQQVAMAEAVFTTNKKALGGLSGATAALGRWLAWSDGEGRPSAFRAAVAALGIKPHKGPAAGKERDARAPRPGHEPYTAGELKALAKVWGASAAREGLVLLCMAQGHKVGEVLALPRRRIGTPPYDGGYWPTLAMLMGGRSSKTVAEWLTGRDGASPLAGEAAYQRVNRYLRRSAAEAGLEGATHLDRLSRKAAA
jgi:hypothetical protein